MIKVKKTLLALLVLLVFLTACKAEKTPPVSEDGEQDTVISENTSQSTKQDKEEYTKKPEILSVNKKTACLYEFYLDTPEMLAKTKYSSLVLGDEDKELYLALAKRLETNATMAKNSMTDEFDNHVAAAEYDVANGGLDNLKTYVSTLDAQIRRADSVAFSVLSDSYSDTRYIENLRSFSGYTYDTQSGKELLITDVIKDMGKLADIVEKELTSHMWTGEFLSENILEDFFKNTRAEDIYWTLDYNGVTFYFYAGCIAEEAYGNVTVTVGFEEYPEIFVKKYMNVPDCYSVRIPVSSSFFADLDNDGELDELVLAAQKDENYGGYSGLNIVTSGGFYEEEIFAYGFNPYYVKTAEDKHFLYVFPEGAEDFHRLMRLYVYEITGGTIQKYYEFAYAPHHYVDEEDFDVFSLPTNPERMLFDVFHEQEDFFYPAYEAEFYVDEDGSASNTVYVDSVKGLVDALSNGVSICVKKGKYNISDYIESLSEREMDEIIENNPHVYFRECIKGHELVFMNLSDISIFGETLKAEDVEFVTDYRYATVLTFENCFNVDVAGMTLGHTDMSECEGDVLGFSGCGEVTINQADLYGCGVYGITATSYCSDFYVSGTDIRDCSDGPLYITEGLGDFVFFDCNLYSSDGYAYYEKTPESSLEFYNCSFGRRETEYFMFHEDVYAEKCAWEEDIEYPEYGYDSEPETAVSYFDPAVMEMAPIDKEKLNDTIWTGYMNVVQESGYTTYLPEHVGGDEYIGASLELMSDGRAFIEHMGAYLTGKWYGYDNDDYSICIALDNGFYAYVSMFEHPDARGRDEWIMLQLGENIVWLYRS